MAGRVWFLWSAIAWAKQGVRHFTYRASYFFSSIFFFLIGACFNNNTPLGFVVVSLRWENKLGRLLLFYYFYSKLIIFILNWGEGASQEDREEDATGTIRWIWISKPSLKNARRKRPSPTSKTFVPGQEVRVPEEARQTPLREHSHGLFGATVNYLNTRW